MTTMAAITDRLGEAVARNIARRMDRLGWDFDRLAVESGLTWGGLVHHRGDAGGMVVYEVEQVAAALGVSPAVLFELEQVEQ